MPENQDIVSESPTVRKPRQLTLKQRKYIELRLSGMGVYDSYMLAYDSKMNNASARGQATKIEHTPIVAAALTELNARALEAAGVTAEMIVTRAWEVANENKSDRVPALALLAKRHPEFRDAAVTVDARTLIVTRGLLDVDDN